MNLRQIEILGVFCIWLEEQPPSRVCQRFIAELRKHLPSAAAGGRA